MASALAKAMKGEVVSDRQAKTALDEAVGKITNLQKTAKQAKDQLAGSLENATGAVVHTVETQATIFGFSMVEGYRGGPDRMQLGKVDVRAPLGLAGMTYGMAGCFMELPGSSHALALSNGVVGSWLASLGAQAGLALAEKRGVVQPMPAPAPAPAMQGMDFGSDVRQIVLTPEPSAEGDFDFGRQRRGGGRSERRGRSGGQGRGGKGQGQGGQGRSGGMSFEERKERDGGQGRQKAMQRGQAMRRARIQRSQGGGQGGQGGQGGGGQGRGGRGRGGQNRFRQGPQQFEQYEQTEEQAA